MTLVVGRTTENLSIAGGILRDLMFSTHAAMLQIFSRTHMGPLPLICTIHWEIIWVQSSFGSLLLMMCKQLTKRLNKSFLFVPKLKAYRKGTNLLQND